MHLVWNFMQIIDRTRTIALVALTREWKNDSLIKIKLETLKKMSASSFYCIVTIKGYFWLD